MYSNKKIDLEILDYLMKFHFIFEKELHNSNSKYKNFYNVICNIYLNHNLYGGDYRNMVKLKTLITYIIY